MKEFLEQIAAHGPRFLTEFSDYTSGPKRFIRQLDLGASDAVSRALIFYVLCLTVSFLLELPTITGMKEWWIVLALRIVYFIMGTVLFAAVYKVSFLCVRGKGLFRDHILVTLYVFGPITILLTVLAAGTKGIVLTEAPHLYPLFKEYMDGLLWLKVDQMLTEKYIPLYKSAPVLIALIFSLIIWVATSVWFMINWGCYRYIKWQRSAEVGLGVYCSGIFASTRFLFFRVSGAWVWC